MFRGEALRYGCGFPPAEWGRNLEAPGAKGKIEGAIYKIKTSRKVDEL